MPFYPTTEKMAAPSSSVTTQIPISVLTTSTPSAATEKTVKQNQEQVRDASVPIPLPYDRLSDDSGKSAGSSASVDLRADKFVFQRLFTHTSAVIMHPALINSSSSACLFISALVYSFQRCYYASSAYRLRQMTVMYRSSSSFFLSWLNDSTDTTQKQQKGAVYQPKSLVGSLLLPPEKRQFSGVNFGSVLNGLRNGSTPASHGKERRQGRQNSICSKSNRVGKL
jgi:hypothetical protein